MQFGGRVSADAPDPMDGLRDRAATLGVPVAGFVAQRHLADWGVSAGGTGEQRFGGRMVTTSASFSRGYTFWADPDDRSAPANLADLAPATQEALDAEPPRDLPVWMHRHRERMRYPSLFEAVQTHWFTPEADHSSDPAEVLRHHVDYVLHNRFGHAYGVDPLERGWRELVSLAAVQPSTMLVDREQRAGVMIDTDAFVLGIGAALGNGLVVTAVIERSLLDRVVLAFDSDPDRIADARGSTSE